MTVSVRVQSPPDKGAIVVTRNTGVQAYISTDIIKPGEFRDYAVYDNIQIEIREVKPEDM